ncbi:50S ribosomal protein L23 [Gammaproteobacteria bacterium SCGC AG-212-F23]|nr:50S ribosomal protein L23 [Gammaproteobacteria bacterium SCGC AG-212-F23]
MKQERLLRVILSPHSSEKAARASSENNQYVFRVASCATKLEIKDAAEELFKVKVKSVRIVNVKTKPKRFGQTMGRSKAWKKAYITLKEGQIALAGAQ